MEPAILLNAAMLNSEKSYNAIRRTRAELWLVAKWAESAPANDVFFFLIFRTLLPGIIRCKTDETVPHGINNALDDEKSD